MLSRQNIVQTWNLSFWCSMSSWGTHLSSFFTFPTLCKWRETVAALTPSVWDISLTVRGFFSTIAFNCSLSRLHARPLPSSSSRLSSPLRNVWNPLRTNDHLWIPLPMFRWYWQKFWFRFKLMQHQKEEFTFLHIHHRVACMLQKYLLLYITNYYWAHNK